VEEIRPRPRSYVTKSGYYVVGNGVSISSETGRYFTGTKGQKGAGDVIELWMKFKDTSFFDAVVQLTEWCIMREKRKTHLSKPAGISINDLKRLFLQALEEQTLIKDGQTVFKKKNGKSTHWNSKRGFWKIVQAAYGEDCKDSKYFASPDKLEELLEIFITNKPLFEMKKRIFETRDLKRNRITTHTEYSLVLTDIPLR